MLKRHVLHKNSLDSEEERVGWQIITVDQMVYTDLSEILLTKPTFTRRAIDLDRVAVAQLSAIHHLTSNARFWLQRWRAGMGWRRRGG